MTNWNLACLTSMLSACWIYESGLSPERNCRSSIAWWFNSSFSTTRGMAALRFNSDGQKDSISDKDWETVPVSLLHWSWACLIPDGEGGGCCLSCLPPSPRALATGEIILPRPRRMAVMFKVIVLSGMAKAPACIRGEEMGPVAVLAEPGLDVDGSFLFKRPLGSRQHRPRQQSMVPAQHCLMPGHQSWNLPG